MMLNIQMHDNTNLKYVGVYAYEMGPGYIEVTYPMYRRIDLEVIKSITESLPSTKTHTNRIVYMEGFK